MAYLHIFCPHCGHAHDVAEEHFAHTESRLLKCAQCDQVWRYHKSGLAQASVDELRENYEKTTAVAPSNAPSTFSLEENPHPGMEQNFERGQRQNSPMRSEQTSSQPPIFAPPPLRAVKYKNAVHRYGLDWWILAIAAVVAMVALVNETGEIPSMQWFYIQFQETITRVKSHFFQSRDLALLPNEVSLHVLTSKLLENKETPVLKVQYEVINNAQTQKLLPPVCISLMDQGEAGQTVLRTSWNHMHENIQMTPGEKRVFETSGGCLKNTLPFTVKVSFKK